MLKPLFQRPFPGPALLLLGVLCCLPAPAQARPPALAVVEAAAREWLQGRQRELDVPTARIVTTVVPPARPALACAHPQARVEDGSRLDRLQVALRCPAPDTAVDLYTVRASLLAPVVVTGEPIAAGQVLTQEMLGQVERDLALVPDALTDPARAAGRSLRRGLRAGQVLQERFLYSVDGVRRGQVVRIVAGREGFEVSIAGIALQDGAPEAMVTVRNQSTGRIVPARVVGNGVVRLAASD